MILKPGDKAPDFKLPGNSASNIALKDFRGKKVILYFYPKDDTSGCTAQACDFRDNLKRLEKGGAAVIGVSRDTVKSHDKFAEKYDLNFPLASDESGDICQLYGVWVEKSMYGRKYMGIERSTFLIDEKGVITHIWRKVKPASQMADITAALKDKAA